MHLAPMVSICSHMTQTLKGMSTFEGVHIANAQGLDSGLYKIADLLYHCELIHAAVKS